MLINLTCIFLFLAGIYFAIITYRATKKKEVFFIIGIFLFSLYLEAIRLHQGSYKLGLNDVLWTSRDILWTGVMIYFFQCMRDNFSLDKNMPSPKKKIRTRMLK